MSAAAASCPRLAQLRTLLTAKTCFASALSLKPSLEEAIQDAAERALQGMLGTVDFAVLFVANYGSAKKFRTRSDVAHAATMLLDHLPRAVPVVGCSTTGVMALAASGSAADLDPGSRQHERGVALLLGRLPGCGVRAFAAAKLPRPCGGSSASGSTPVAGSWPEMQDALAALASECGADAPRGWCSSSSGRGGDGGSGGGGSGGGGGDRGGSGGDGGGGDGGCGSGDGGCGTVPRPLPPPLLLLLLFSNRSAAYHGVDALLSWLSSYLPPDVPVIGGASSGSGELFCHPGPHPADADPSPARYVGLAIVPLPSQAPQQPQRPSPPPPPRVAAAGLAVEGIGAEPGAPLFRAVHARVLPGHILDNCAELRVLSCRVAGEGCGQGGAPTPPRAAGTPQPDAFRLGSAITASAMHQVALWRQPAHEVAAIAAAAAAAASRQRQQQQPRQERQDAVEVEAAEGSSSGAFSGGGADGALGAVAAVCLLPPLRLVLYPLEVSWCESDGSLSLLLEASDSERAQLSRLVHGGGGGGAGEGELCMQLVSPSGRASEALLRQHLPELCRRVRGGGGGGGGGGRGWGARGGAGAADPDGCYAAAAHSARCAGASSGPAALASFTCTGRGQALYGRPGVESGLMGLSGLPFVGSYCDGEVGPCVEGGAVAWSGGGSLRRQAFTSMIVGMGVRA